MKQESSESPHSDNAAPDPPPRSRNARAQARHREKRKQYIQSLEQTVARLQAAVTGTPDQQARTHELEQENMRLRSENEMLKAQLGWSPLDPATRRTPVGLFAGHPPDGLVSEAQRDLKRRRTSAEGAGDPSHPYLGPAPHHHHSDSSTFRSLQALPPTTSSAHASSSSTYGSLSSHANGGSAPPPAGSTTTPLYAFHSSRSSASSPYSASSLSPLPDLVTAPRRAFDAFGPGDRMDPLAMGGPLHTQQQQQPSNLPQPLGSQAFDRRSSESSGFMDNPFGAQVDLDTWRSYTSYARGT